MCLRWEKKDFFFYFYFYFWWNLRIKAHIAMFALLYFDFALPSPDLTSGGGWRGVVAKRRERVIASSYRNQSMNQQSIKIHQMNEK